MRKKRATEHKTLPRLLVPKEEVAQRIKTQIDKGNNLRNLSIVSEADLEAAQREESKWSSYNIELLARLFNNTSPAEEYQVGVSLPLEDIFEDQEERFRKDVADRIASLESILERLDLMALSSTTRTGVSSVEVTREGVFFEGQYFDAFQLVKEILSLAQQSIVIIDSYINNDLLSLLSLKQPSVEVKILTKDFSSALRAAATAFNKQYGKLTVRISRAFHDRFLFIDDKDFYHFGASLKDLGHRGFMFSRMEEPKVIEEVRREFAQEWGKSPVEVQGLPN